MLLHVLKCLPRSLCLWETKKKRKKKKKKIWKNSKLKVDTCITAGRVILSLQIWNWFVIFCRHDATRVLLFSAPQLPAPNSHTMFSIAVLLRKGDKSHPTCAAAGVLLQECCNVCVNVSRSSQNSKLALSSLHGKCRRILHVFICGHLKGFVSAAILSLWLFMARALKWEETWCKAMHDSLHNNSILSQLKLNK